MLTFKFKIPKKSDRVYLSGGLICNGHWLMDASWLESLTSAESLPARKMLKRYQLAEVQKRLEGHDCKRVDLESLIPKYSDGEYFAMALNGDDSDCKITAKIVFPPFKESAQPRLTQVLMHYGSKHISLDSEYFPILFFDRTCGVYIKDAKSPVIIKQGQKIVALLMPLKQKES